MEELFPALVRMMEERFGRFGRPLTTILLIFVALGLASWGGSLFWDNALAPLAKFIIEVSKGIIPEQWREILIRVGTTILVTGVVFTILVTWLKRWFDKREMRIKAYITKAAKISNDAEDEIVKAKEAWGNNKKMLDNVNQLLQKVDASISKTESIPDKEDSQKQ